MDHQIIGQQGWLVWLKLLPTSLSLFHVLWNGVCARNLPYSEHTRAEGITRCTLPETMASIGKTLTFINIHLPVHFSFSHAGTITTSNCKPFEIPDHSCDSTLVLTFDQKSVAVVWNVSYSWSLNKSNRYNQRTGRHKPGARTRLRPGDSKRHISDKVVY